MLTLEVVENNNVLKIKYSLFKTTNSKFIFCGGGSSDSSGGSCKIYKFVTFIWITKNIAPG